MTQHKNILFIMFDQLRFDYLSCAGHPHLHTPNIDWLARQAVRFNRCYVQSPVCGASRMSFYTGRYTSSHGASWNGVPLKVGEWTMGDHLREVGMDAMLLGKTHMRVDADGMRRLGLAPDTVIGARLSECGFDALIRDDGLWAEGPDGAYDSNPSPYNAYLRQSGYEADNPWHDYANAGIDEDGNVASGWLYRNAHLPANIREQDSETPWLTRQMMAFLDDGARARVRPWLCHLSYIKPHWPYIVPAPYHTMYGPDSFKPVVRHENELVDPHPIYAAFAGNVIGKAFQRDDVRNAALGAYMGLIKQIDDQMGKLFTHLKSTGQLDNTVIVITSDHGDYMGDHWLGEKDLFHDPSVRVPLIVYDPSPEADATRGTISDALVESIDLLPTFIEMAGGTPRYEMLEGRSLMPFLHGDSPAGWRDYAISEYDYSVTPMAAKLGVAPRDARLFMVCDDRWKFIHAEAGFPPMLFDLHKDPDEFVDLGRHADYDDVRTACYDKLFAWTRRCAQRTTVSNQQLVARRDNSRRDGVILGINDADEIDADLIAKYQGKARQKHS
jgi:arylsulfatase A-like enzyme